jgi:ABC-type multidrug transport system fused ATPase/permease subunit
MKKFVNIIMSKFEILQNWKYENEISYIDKQLEINFELNKKIINHTIITDIMMKIFIDGSKVAIILMFWIWFLNQTINFWEFVSLMSIIYILDQIFTKSIDTYINFTKIIVDVEKLWDFFDNAPQIKWYEEWNKFIHKKGDIEIKNMNFGYIEEKNIFTDFSLKIEWEQVLALVWDSGGWKSTVAKMISGYMRPNSWEIIIDNQELSQTSLKSYYKDVWYLTQDPSVFDGSILENLTYALEEKVSDEKINEIIIQAKCEFIYDLPNALDTQIWERWVKLSGWQKQRLAIAKIFLKDPKIIILDEPTSALDSFSEEQITKAMKNLFQNRTVIVIAHRLQTVKHADRILVLENWKIVEDGNHDELVKNEWKYAKMLELQSGF